MWPPLPPTASLRRPATTLPWPLEEPHCRLFSRARHALWHGVRGYGLGPGDEVLVPAYNHGSEVEALHSTGVECVFYDLDARLEPFEERLNAALTKRTKALYLIHYLGLPQDSRRWRRWCDDHGILLFEDAAQAWLATSDGVPVGSLADLSIYCLYKTFGYPDGAALMSLTPPQPLHRGNIQALALAKRHAAWFTGRFGWSASLMSASDPDGYDPAADFALGDPDSIPSGATRWLLAHMAHEGAAEQRRARYRLLLEELGDRVPSPFDDLPEGASPFALPIQVEHKDRVLERVREGGVAGLNLWSAPHPLVAAAGPFNVDDRRTHTVGLPVHQELRPADLKRIVSAAAGTPRRRSSAELEFGSSLSAFKEEWTRLAEKSRNVFSTWEWADSWSKQFLGNRPVSLALLRAPDSSPLALFPLYLWTDRPFKVVRILGHGPGDQLGPVCDPGIAPKAALALGTVLARLPWGYDLFLGDYLSRSEEWGALLGAHTLRRFESPLLRFDGSWDAFVKQRSRNFREQLSRRERALRKKHEVRFRLADDVARLDDDLTTLFELYDARWREGERAFSVQQVFHRDFAHRAHERGWLRLWFLELDGRPVAAWYGFRYAGVESFYQGGRDPKHADSSVGFILLAHTIKETLNDGIKEYRLLRGGESYKYRFATEDPGLESVALGSSWVARSSLVLSTRLGSWGPARKVVGRRLSRITHA